ncbi:MAG: hypothetical protein JWM12_1833, partial [Ilumatobacteraceae bacterium]|nr:hypothetical protein [Ilumatobacteraceae bacterium]
DEPLDLAALHRRMSVQNRRRVVVRVGVAGAGVAAVVGGLLVIGDARPGPVVSGLPAAGPVASTPSPVEPAALPDCGDLLTQVRTAVSTAKTVLEDVPSDRSASAGEVSGVGFKGIVTILTIDGPRLTFRSDEPKLAPPTAGLGTLDADTVWVDGPTPLEPPPTLQVGEQLGLATSRAGDGVDHVVFIDVSAAVRVDEKPAADKTPTASSESSSTRPDRSATPDTIVEPGADLPSGPTEKALGTIAALDATSITVTLDDQSGQTRTFAIDLATTRFDVGDTPCVPGSLDAGAQLGVAFHFDDAGNLIADNVMLVP